MWPRATDIIDSCVSFDLLVLKVFKKTEGKKGWSSDIENHLSACDKIKNQEDLKYYLLNAWLLLDGQQLWVMKRKITDWPHFLSLWPFLSFQHKFQTLKWLPHLSRTDRCSGNKIFIEMLQYFKVTWTYVFHFLTYQITEKTQNTNFGSWPWRSLFCWKKRKINIQPKTGTFHFQPVLTLQKGFDWIVWPK